PPALVHLPGELCPGSPGHRVADGDPAVVAPAARHRVRDRPAAGPGPPARGGARGGEGAWGPGRWGGLMTTVQPVAAAAPGRQPWVLISGGFHDYSGQPKANAALADYLLQRGTPVHLVAHDIDARYLGRPGCAVYRVARPLGKYFLGELWLRRRGRA